jgi:hypothetical protein
MKNLEAIINSRIGFGYYQGRVYFILLSFEAYFVIGSIEFIDGM